MMNVALHEWSGTCEELLALFEGAHETDKWAEGKKKLFTIIGVVALVIGILLFIIAVSAESAALAAAGSLVVASLIFIFAMRKKYGAYDLDDRKLATIFQFLKIIQADCKPKAALKVMIDFRDYLTGGQMTANENIDPGIFASNVRVKKYQHPWLQVSGSLADGTRYEVGVTEAITRKEKPKRKYTKVKEKTTSIISIKLRLQTERYGDPNVAAAALQQLKPPQSMTVKAIRAQGQALSLVLVADTIITVHGRYGVDMPSPGLEVTGNELLKAMLWAYDGIARAAASRAA